MSDGPAMRSSPEWSGGGAGSEHCEGCGAVGVSVEMTRTWYDLQPAPDGDIDWYPHTAERCRALRSAPRQ